jgi:hypothetical protein
MFEPETKDPFNDTMSAIVDAAIVQKRLSQPKRQYLGASMWGDPCERKLAYMFHQTPEDDGSGFPPNVLRIFDMGHDGEDRAAEYIRIAGFELVTHKEDGKQFGFSAVDGLLKGHIDGIITGGPAVAGVEYPVLWENKALNGKSYNDTLKKGVKLSKPLYYAQAQTYMAYLDLPNGCVFSFMNRDSGEMSYEFLKFDPRSAQESSDKAVRVVKTQSPEESPKCTDDRADFRCKFCNFKNRCWGTTPQLEQKIITETPKWLTKS